MLKSRMSLRFMQVAPLAWVVLRNVVSGHGGSDSEKYEAVPDSLLVRAGSGMV